MNAFVNLARQGDVTIRRVDEFPERLRDVTPDNGELIVAHSETGHHHMINSKTARLLQGEDPSVCYLQLAEPETLVHMRSWDTHRPVDFVPGKFKILRAREETPEGWRMVRD